MLDQGSVCLPDHLFASAVFQAATLASVEFRYSPAVSLTVPAAILSDSHRFCTTVLLSVLSLLQACLMCKTVSGGRLRYAVIHIALTSMHVYISLYVSRCQA